MNNFVFCTPTKVIFGKGIEPTIGEHLRSFGAEKVLLHYGGGSAKRSGLLDQVTASLESAGLPYVELGGVAPNPKLSLIRKGIALCREEGVNFLLAVGGGSVIDSAKAIGVGLANGCDPWDFIESKTAPAKCAPVGVVLTLSAAGSEMSNSDVITNDENQLKRGITSEAVRPVVAFLNPENTYTVSKFQTGCGIVDTMMHTLERYFTGDSDCDLTDRLAEGLLIAVRDAGRAAIANPEDYNARATLMWASSLSHNDVTGCGKNRKFPVHKIEHDISGVHDNVAHGAGLAVLFPAWAEYVLQYDVMKFAQLAARVWGVEMNFDHPEVTAREGIRAMRAYFREIGMPTTMGELGISPDGYEEIVEKTTLGGTVLKSYLPLGREEILEIYRLAE
ncbi:iron-containing alcohol dehydrogenase [Clostridiaceae bacterium]|nr:iron-containing alcohol dehydrogenase [Clostridiaceae bacterium]